MPSGKAFSLSRLVVTTRRCLDDELRPSAYTLYPIYPPLAGSVPSIVVTPECILQSHQNTDEEGLFKSLLDSHSQCPSHYSARTLPRAHRSHLICLHLPNLLPDDSISCVFILPKDSACRSSLEHLLPG